eukprot:CAMPEP_0181430446 /NCGR_PEP_ID=MMETSP1110-20121109/17726_1 /TAXON_ID=174948 /ORGANISM="Symbiodinium sp., Strain CCMP421" /LENGTH=63 /DNA_ID=CAMNT_0023553759 /DNA_START=12 /DNA_END=200 /DNA_ORIENTATION=-
MGAVLLAGRAGVAAVGRVPGCQVGTARVGTGRALILASALPLPIGDLGSVPATPTLAVAALAL